MRARPFQPPRVGDQLEPRQPGSPSMLRGVLLGPVLGEAGVALLRGPVEELGRASLVQIHERHGVTARASTRVDVDPDDRPGPGYSGNRASSGAASGASAGTSTVPAPVEPDDVGPARERAEHQRDPAVLAQVRDRLDAAPGEVEVGDRVLVEHPERVEALGRHVDVAVVPAGRGRDEEHGLRLEELVSSGVMPSQRPGSVRPRPPNATAPRRASASPPRAW